MTQPGDRLRAFACRVCGRETLERVIDPLIADLQFEHTNAVRAGRIWHARRLLLGGYFVFWKALGMQVAAASGHAVRAWLSSDGHALGRTLAFSLALIATLTALLALMPMYAVRPWRAPDVSSMTLFVYVIPQAIPLAVIFGLPIGILCGLRGRHVKRPRRGIGDERRSRDRARDVRRSRVDPSRNQPGVSAFGNRAGVPSQRRQRADAVGAALALGRLGYAGCSCKVLLRPLGHLVRADRARSVCGQSLGDQTADLDLRSHKRSCFGDVRGFRLARLARTAGESFVRVIASMGAAQVVARLGNCLAPKPPFCSDGLHPLRLLEQCCAAPS
jgi:hypothetical protein